LDEGGEHMFDFNQNFPRIVGILLIMAAMAMLFNPSLREGNILLMVIVVAAECLIIITGLLFLVLPPNEIVEIFRPLVLGIPGFLIRLVFASLFLGTFFALVIFLLFPELVPLPQMTIMQEQILKVKREVQIIGCICSSSILGGFVHKVLTHDTRRRRALATDGEITAADLSFWEVIKALFCSLFVSLVIFFLIRAGILKAVEVDTFNIYGVTAVSAITGYFAENIINRLRMVYETILGDAENK
jgi:hypothetical protein